MFVVKLLMLLFSIAEIHTETQDTSQQDISSELRQLTDMVMELSGQLTITKNELQDTKAELYKMKTKLANARLAEATTGAVSLTSKVAFSAGLLESGLSVQSGTTELNLVFRKIITNVGDAYSDISGFFTAPVKGVYYFRFTVMDLLHSHWMTIKMYKNRGQVVRLDEYETDGIHTYLSSGLTLLLEVGDKVNLRLPAHRSLVDDSNNHSTFTGFLLFPL